MEIKTCLSLSKEDQIKKKKIHTTDKDKLNEDFNNFQKFL